jgi:hypothetical protein
MSSPVWFIKFIEKANYIWKMDTCICRAGAKCKDYPIDLACLFMGELDAPLTDFRA